MRCGSTAGRVLRYWHSRRRHVGGRGGGRRRTGARGGAGAPYRSQLGPLTQRRVLGRFAGLGKVLGRAAARHLRKAKPGQAARSAQCGLCCCRSHSCAAREQAANSTYAPHCAEQRHLRSQQRSRACLQLRGSARLAASPRWPPHGASALRAGRPAAAPAASGPRSAVLWPQRCGPPASRASRLSGRVHSRSCCAAVLLAVLRASA